MVPENRKERLVGAQAIVAAKRARAKAAQAPAEGTGAAAEASVENGPAGAPPAAADGGVASATAATGAVAMPLPVQAREVDTAQEPRAHTTCKRCAATVDADAAECWNCGLSLRLR